MAEEGENRGISCTRGRGKIVKEEYWSEPRGKASEREGKRRMRKS